MLLEAGGCASWAEGNPTPDPFYVDQAKATLLQMESHDVFNHCEIRYIYQLISIESYRISSASL